MVFEIEEGAQWPMQRLGEVRDLGEQVVGRVRQDSPGRPLAMSTVNSLAHEGQVTVALVWRETLILR